MFASIISNYGAEAKAKLSSPAITGAPEDQIRAPIEALFKALSMAAGMQQVVPPVRYGFRSFDRQWIIPDHRLISQARSEMWKTDGTHQVYLTAIEDFAPENGPAITLTGHIPDGHHYHGRGGRVLPLWRDSSASQSNIKPALLDYLSTAYGQPVTAPEVMAYIAATLAHPAFTARFKADLVRPGLRVPFTADAALFQKAVALGQQVIWLHCYGERFADPAASRPAAPPRMAAGTGPTIPMGGAIPGAGHPLPDTMRYENGRLYIGAGYVENVTAAMWDYQVSGRNVLRSWFSYRKADRTRPIIGDKRPPSDLEKIQPDHWLPEYTEDLPNLLHVLGRLTQIEGDLAALLDSICTGPLLTETAITAAGALAASPVPKPSKKSAGTGQPTLFD